MSLILLLVILLSRRHPFHAGSVERWLAHRHAPIVLGCLTTLLAWSHVEWSTDPVAVIHDEAVYQLQASLFASGRWTDTAPADPTPFRQMYVLDAGRIAPKYPPGHAFALTPGFLLGVPYLMPLLLTGLAGGLVFVLARRWSTAPIAFATWAFWLGCWETIRWQATWFSETTSLALMLTGWWLLPSASRHRPAAWGLGVVTGWLAITRPLTAVAFVIPVAVMMLLEARRTRRVGPILRATCGALPVLAVLPLWSLQSTGDPWRTPLTVYTERHLPWDRMGFGVSPDLPSDPLRDEQAGMEQFMREMHAAQRAERYPAIVAGHLAHSLEGRAPGGIWLLLPLGVLGVAALPWWASLTAALQYLAYALYAHPPEWTVYYAELGPLVAFAIAAGVAAALRRTGLAREQPVLVLLTLLVVAVTIVRHGEHRDRLAQVGAPIRDFHRALQDVPPRSIVFVAYPPSPNPHVSLVANRGPRERQPVLVAYDRGHAANVALAARHRRRPFLYRVREGRLVGISAAPADTAVAPSTVPTVP